MGLQWRDVAVHSREARVPANEQYAWQLALERAQCGEYDELEKLVREHVVRNDVLQSTAVTILAGNYGPGFYRTPAGEWMRTNVTPSVHIVATEVDPGRHAI